MTLLELRPCSAQKPLTETRGSRASPAALQFQLGALLLGENLAQFGAGLAGTLQGLIDVDFRCIEEAHRVGQFDALFGIDIEQARQTEERGLQLGARDDQALLFILQLHVGAQGIDAGADAVLLQVGRLVVEGLRQIDARLGGLDIGGGALAAEVLRDHEQHALLADAESPGRARNRCPTGWRDSGATA